MTARHDLLSGSEILDFYKSGFLCPGRVFDDAEVDTLRGFGAPVQDRERDEGRVYDLLDPDLWPGIDAVLRMSHG